MWAILLFHSLVGQASLGPTFGNAIPGIPVCGNSQPPSVVMNATLDPGATHAVLHHFWTTGAADKIDRMWVEYYIDGETTPSIAFQPSMMCGTAFPYRNEHDFEYAAGSLCGKSAPVGGWFNTFPIPMYKSALVTVRADPSDGDGCFDGFVSVRGTPGMPLSLPLSAVPLPNGTRLRLQKNALAVQQPLDFVTVASLEEGLKGLLFMVSWAVLTMPQGGAAAGGGYIEGCWNVRGQASMPRARPLLARRGALSSARRVLPRSPRRG